ncbi:ubiquitin domain-containing protein [Apiospora arundinis]|uniref:Ubiquitin domain-containing protein n=1 Tax=Apiospora arundinis TaxID=335852 RepID=A0ABR2I9B2_9PEZI
METFVQAKQAILRLVNALPRTPPPDRMRMQQEWIRLLNQVTDMLSGIEETGGAEGHHLRQTLLSTSPQTSGLRPAPGLPSPTPSAERCQRRAGGARHNRETSNEPCRNDDIQTGTRAEAIRRRDTRLVPQLAESIGTRARLDELKEAWAQTEPCVLPSWTQALNVAEAVEAIDLLESSVFKQEIQRRFYLTALMAQYERVATELSGSRPEHETRARERVARQYCRPDSEVLRILMEQAWPRLKRAATVAASSAEYQTKLDQLKKKIKAARRWAALDRALGTGAFSLVPAGAKTDFGSKKVERLTDCHFQRLVWSLEERKEAIGQVAREASALIGISYSVHDRLMGSIPDTWHPRGRWVLWKAAPLSVALRLSDAQQSDVTVEFMPWDTVRVVRDRLALELGLTHRRGLRLMYLGKPLDEESPLPTQGWREGHVVSAFQLHVDGNERVVEKPR